MSKNATHKAPLNKLPLNVPFSSFQNKSKEVPKIDIVPVGLGPNIPIFMPFIPNFMNYFAQAPGLYEGIPMLPSLYANSRYPHNFQRNVSIVMTTIAVFVMFFAPICILAYGRDLRDVVLLNLPYGTYETMVQASYSLCLIYNIATSLFPIISIFNGLH